MKVIAIPSSIVITTLVYALLVATTFFEMDNALGEGEDFVVDDVNDDYKTMTYNTQQVEAVAVETSSCKSPCPPNSTELCITMCA